MSVALLISLSTTATRRDAVDMDAGRLLKCARIGNRIPASFSTRAKNSSLLLHPGEKVVDVADDVVTPHVEGIETGLWGFLILERPLLSGGVPCSIPGKPVEVLHGLAHVPQLPGMRLKGAAIGHARFQSRGKVADSLQDGSLCLADVRDAPGLPLLALSEVRPQGLDLRRYVFGRLPAVLNAGTRQSGRGCDKNLEILDRLDKDPHARRRHGLRVLRCGQRRQEIGA